MTIYMFYDEILDNKQKICSQIIFTVFRKNDFTVYGLHKGHPPTSGFIIFIFQIKIIFSNYQRGNEYGQIEEQIFQWLTLNQGH